MTELSEAETVDMCELPPIPSMPLTSMSAHVDVELAALSHTGKIRPNNEDHFLVARFDREMRTLLSNLPKGSVPESCGETAYGLLVADGMGGHAAGEIASGKAIGELVDLVLRTPDWIMRPDDEMIREVMRRMEDRFGRVSERLANMARQDPSLAGMGTTLTLACSLGADMVVSHVGDSRAYLFHRGVLHRLTSDHTYAQALVDSGKIRPVDATKHPLRHALTRALGMAGGDQAEVQQVSLSNGDQILLCTDGLSDPVPESTIADVLRNAKSATEACQTLMDLSLEAGGRDNITAVLARYTIPEGPEKT